MMALYTVCVITCNEFVLCLNEGFRWQGQFYYDVVISLNDNTEFKINENTMSYDEAEKKQRTFETEIFQARRKP